MAVSPEYPAQPVQPTESATPSPANPEPAPDGTSPKARPGLHLKPRQKSSRGLPRTRTGTAWASIVSSVLLLILLVVFISQNAHPVDVSFLMLHGRFPLAVALLAAVAGGALVAVIAGTLRMVQLRRAVPRHVVEPAPTPTTPQPSVPQQAAPRSPTGPEDAPQSPVMVKEQREE